MTTVVDLRTPCIIAPSDENSTEKLYRYEFDNLDCEWVSFSRDRLYEIFATGFFDYLNEKYDLLISDYEEEEIVSTEILETILKDDLKKFKTLQYSDFWNGLEKCLVNAIKKETGIFFFF